MAGRAVITPGLLYYRVGFYPTGATLLQSGFLPLQGYKWVFSPPGLHYYRVGFYPFRATLLQSGFLPFRVTSGFLALQGYTITEWGFTPSGLYCYRVGFVHLQGYKWVFPPPELHDYRLGFYPSRASLLHSLFLPLVDCTQNSYPLTN